MKAILFLMALITCWHVSGYYHTNNDIKAIGDAYLTGIEVGKREAYDNIASYSTPLIEYYCDEVKKKGH